MIKSYTKTENGSALIGLIIALTTLIGLGAALVSLVISLSINAHKSAQRLVALNLAEAGLEKTIWDLNTPALPTCTSPCTLDTGQFEVSVSNLSGESKEITSTGYVPAKANYKMKKTVKVTVAATPSADGRAFSYAILSGPGGIEIGGSSDIQGNIYSNGNIVVSGAGHVTGHAWAVGTITGGAKIDGTKTEGVAAVPMVEVDIDEWKTLATSGGTITGDYSIPNSGEFTDFGPKKITGGISASGSNQKLNVTGPLYIQGNVNISGGTFKPAESIGGKAVVIVVDGTVSISGTSVFQKNSSGGYLYFISTNTNLDCSNPAISYNSGNGHELSLYAYNGSLKLGGSGNVYAIMGQKLCLSGSGNLNYQSGYALPGYYGGPGGSWVKQLWQELSNL